MHVRPYAPYAAPDLYVCRTPVSVAVWIAASIRWRMTASSKVGHRFVLPDIAGQVDINLRHIERESGWRLRRGPTVCVRNGKRRHRGVLTVSTLQRQLQHLDVPPSSRDQEVAVRPIDLPEQVGAT